MTVLLPEWPKEMLGPYFECQPIRAGADWLDQVWAISTDSQHTAQLRLVGWPISQELLAFPSMSRLTNVKHFSSNYNYNIPIFLSVKSSLVSILFILPDFIIEVLDKMFNALFILEQKAWLQKYFFK